MSQIPVSELEEAHKEIVHALASRGIQISEVTLTALAIVLVTAAVDHKVNKKLFMNHMKDTWRKAVTAKQLNDAAKKAAKELEKNAEQSEVSTQEAEPTADGQA